MKNKKIIELIPNISEGGAETLVKDYCLLLKDKGYDMEVVTLLPPSQSSSNYQILLKNGIKVTSLDKNRWFYKNWFLRNLWRYTVRPFYATHRLANYISSIKPCCIHVHMRMLEYLVRIPRYLSGIKLLYTCHNEPHLFFNKKRSYLELRAAKKLITTNNLRLIALHESMRLELNEMFSVDTTLVVHNGVDFTRFKDVKVDKSAYRCSVGLNDDDFVVGHVGRFNSQKNHMFLLKIFVDLLNVKPNAKLLLIGDGALRRQVEEEICSLNIKNKCIILEHRGDIPQLMSIMDVFLFPSLFEGLPVTLVEAQAIGLRAVVSNTITSECFFSKNVIPLDLNAPVVKWVNAIVDLSIAGEYRADISRFDMNSVINYLGKLYVDDEAK
jgi:glycosyltransferase involved in cell wall biosynthesis